MRDLRQPDTPRGICLSLHTDQTLRSLSSTEAWEAEDPRTLQRRSKKSLVPGEEENRHAQVLLRSKRSGKREKEREGGLRRERQTGRGGIESRGVGGDLTCFRGAEELESDSKTAVRQTSQSTDRSAAPRQRQKIEQCQQATGAAQQPLNAHTHARTQTCSCGVRRAPAIPRTETSQLEYMR